MSDGPTRPAWRRHLGMRRWLLATCLVIGVGTLLGTLCLFNVAPPQSRTDLTMRDLAGRIRTAFKQGRSIPADLTTLPEHRRDSVDVNDGWGRPMTARWLVGGTVELLSLGRDGRPGGTGEDADLRGVFDPVADDNEWIVRPFENVPSTRPDY